jgi:hypothetical protein
MVAIQALLPPGPLGGILHRGRTPGEARNRRSGRGRVHGGHPRVRRECRFDAPALLRQWSIAVVQAPDAILVDLVHAVDADEVRAALGRRRLAQADVPRVGSARHTAGGRQRCRVGCTGATEIKPRPLQARVGEHIALASPQHPCRRPCATWASRLTTLWRSPSRPKSERADLGRAEVRGDGARQARNGCFRPPPGPTIVSVQPLHLL